jgi:hypothetical protein
MEAAEQTTEDQEFGWLNQPVAEPEEEDAAFAGEAPDWLSELEPEQETTSPEAITAEPDEALTWLDEPAVEAEEELVAANEGVPEWLDQEESEFAEEESGAALFDETEEIEDNEEEAAVEEEFLEPTPAQNAPDWLNAMVPGLDVDYEAADELVEEEEIEASAGDGAKREFAWLVELVEEEMSATERPNFAFSRPPAWVEPTSSAATNGDIDDDLPDWPSDDADADVADWLR